MIQIIKQLYFRYKELINYVIVGGLTTVVSLASYYFFTAVFLNPQDPFQLMAANPGLKILDTSYAEEDYAIGMAKGSSLEDAVNAALKELKADGTLQSIVDKYITAEESGG